MCLTMVNSFSPQTNLRYEAVTTFIFLGIGCSMKEYMLSYLTPIEITTNDLKDKYN